MKRTTLPTAFFDRPTLTVARDLLGKYILRDLSPTQVGRRRREIALIITEVEAYDGPSDLASHARRGITPRTRVMFGPAGIFYVYFTYGMHWMLNIVTGPRDYPAAILLRAGAYRESKTGNVVAVTGPARLTKFLHITGAQNTMRAGKASDLWFEDRGDRVAPTAIGAGPRVGVDYAGTIWAAKPYNFKYKINARG